MAKRDLREWAVKGAEQRLVELAEEARTIFAAFPELRGRGREFGSTTECGDRHRLSSASAVASDVSRRSTEGCLAQKKRWAEWRKKKEKAN